MGVLDQLFDILDSNTRDPAIAPVDTQLSQDDWVVATTSLAAHQGMRNGFESARVNDLIQRKIIASDLGANSVSTILSRPEFGTTGTVNVLRTFTMLDAWEKIVVSQQLADVRYRPTVEDFVDGGIKPGSKVVIEVVKENSRLHDSPFDIISSAISRKNIGGQPVSLLFDKFSVVNFTEPDEARFQIHETFGADIIQSFGRRPRIMMLSGNVLNGKARARINGEIRSMDWKNAFQRFYENYASLHRTVLAGDKIRIYAQDTVWDGYLLNMMSNTTAETQSISQVTISFVVANKYSPQQNDLAIPGYSSDTGFRITINGTTPEDIFPEESLDFHFLENPEKLIDVARENAKLDLQLSEDKIELIDSGLDSAFLAANYDIFSEDFETNSYFTPAEGFRLHKLLTGGQIQDAVVSHVDQVRSLYSDILTANGTTANSGPSGISAEITVDAPDLRARQATLRNAQIGLKNTVNEANDLAIEYVRIQNYYDHLQNL